MTGRGKVRIARLARNEDRRDEPSGTLPTRAERPRRAAPGPSGDPAALPEGYRLGKYRLVRALGAGGMGTVYEAVHVEIGKAVALKVLDLDAAGDAQARARFLREAAAASRIAHPHVVNVTDYGAEQGLPFIVMQLLRGEDLGSRLDANPRGLPVHEVADILLAVCAGVRAAHDAGIVHRDLKPRNIFLARLSSEEISPKVLDFGISKDRGLLWSAALTDPGALLGTTHYLSPEQLEGAEVDGRTDQYALGVVLYECLTGHRPFTGDTPQLVMKNIAAGQPVPPARLRPELPAALEAAVLRALARVPAARFPDVLALGAALLPFASAKRQVAWADFYRAAVPGPLPSRSSPTPARTRAPEPASAPDPEPEDEGPVLATEMLSRRDGRAPHTRTQASRPKRASPASPPPEPRSWEDSLPNPPPSPTASGALSSPAPKRSMGWFFTALCLIVLVASGWRLFQRLTATPAGTPTAAAPPAPTPGLAIEPPVPPAVVTPREEEPPAETPTAVPEITIDVLGAPPGLVAVIDGKELALPMKLPRADTPVAVIFRAPGFAPRRAMIERDRDQTLEVLVREKRRNAQRTRRPREVPSSVTLPMESLSGAPILEP
jgi:eukaryotic-like serine/threonine-protein kinase